MSAAERAGKASSAEQANEWAVRANARTEEQMAHYSTRRLRSHSTYFDLYNDKIAVKKDPPNYVFHNLDLKDLELYKQLRSKKDEFMCLFKKRAYNC